MRHTPLRRCNFRNLSLYSGDSYQIRILYFLDNSAKAFSFFFVHILISRALLNKQLHTLLDMGDGVNVEQAIPTTSSHSINSLTLACGIRTPWVLVSPRFLQSSKKPSILWVHRQLPGSRRAGSQNRSPPDPAGQAALPKRTGCSKALYWMRCRRQCRCNSAQADPVEKAHKGNFCAQVWPRKPVMICIRNHCEAVTGPMLMFH